MSLQCAQMIENLPWHLYPSTGLFVSTLPLPTDAETKGAREGLPKHLEKMYVDGEKDFHRLTVAGLSYLRAVERESRF